MLATSISTPRTGKSKRCSNKLERLITLDLPQIKKLDNPEDSVMLSSKTLLMLMMLLPDLMALKLMEDL
jgi:hypothetical protein